MLKRLSSAAGVEHFSESGDRCGFRDLQLMSALHDLKTAFYDCQITKHYKIADIGVFLFVFFLTRNVISARGAMIANMKILISL